MIYRVTEHYDDNFPNNDYIECFICFENKTKNGEKPIYLQHQRLYLKTCECNGAVHVDCLTICFNTNAKCPICRKNAIKNTEKAYIIVYTIKYGAYIYFYVKYSFIKFLKFLMYFALFYVIIDFYLMVIHNKIKYYDS